MRVFKITYLLFFWVFIQPIFAQDFSDSWTGYFSYLDIKDISQGTNRIFGASENAIFIYNTQTEEIQTLSTINGLSGETISTIHYEEEKELLLIGFENGLIQIYDEVNTEFTFVVDILNKINIPPDFKRINHFNVYNEAVYISTNYGVSLYDLNAFEFGDTYFLGPNGSPLKVNQTAVFQDYIYVASEVQLYRALISNMNLINYQEWESVVAGNWLGISQVGEKLYGATVNGRVYELINGNLPIQLEYYGTSIIGFKEFNDRLIATTNSEVYVYNEDFNELVYVNSSDSFDTDFTKAMINENNELFIGTTGTKSIGKPGHGILKTTYADTSVFEEIHPESPLANSFFELKILEEEIWGVHGGYSSRYGFSGGVSRTGISHFIDDKWKNIVYDSIALKVGNPFYLSHISINSFNKNQVYISSYYSGLIDISNNEPVNIYNQNNSTLLPFAGTRHLTLTSKYDNEGALWITNGRVDTPLNKFLNGNWTSYDFTDLIPEPNSNLGFTNIVFDNSNNLFMGSFNYGIIGFSENNNNTLLRNISSEEENMPSHNVTAVAIDKRNQLWIGTDRGLRVLYNPSSFFTEQNLHAEEIIILEDGIPKELLFQQYVSDIEIDGSNNKWIGTFDSGLFYLSSDGQKTIYHFTKDNSPLPSNTINDVFLDNSKGIVYIATSKGLVSFRSGGSSPLEDLESAYAYPNPVRPSFNIVDEKVKIKDISENVNIKITDISGNLVAEAQSRNNLRYRGYNLEIDGGTAYWNGKNLANNVVASGVYLVMLSDLDTFETKVLKLMVVR